MANLMSSEQRAAAAGVYAAMTTAELNDVASEKQELVAYLVTARREAADRYGDHSGEALELATQAMNARMRLGLMREEQRRREYPGWDASIAAYEARERERDAYERGA